MIRGINSGFSILTRALQASQWAVQLHLKNIANSNDPTYTRRTLENRADPFGRLPQVIRLRDQFIDFQYRRAQASAGYASTRADLFARIEDIFGDPIEGGLALAIDKFFDAFKAVSEDPADEVLRIEAIEAARNFVHHIHQAMSQLSMIKGQINERIASVVTEINAHLQNLRNLNSRIATMVGNTEMAADLMDERDRVLDELARLTGARAVYLEDGTVRVMIGSVPAVDGTAINLLEVVDGDDGPTVKWQGFDLPAYSGDGVLSALLQVRDEDLNHVIQTIDKLAKDLAQAVNDQHKLGYDLDGNPGGDFFLIQPQVPGGIYVHPDLTPRKIAAAQEVINVGGQNKVYESDGGNAFKIYQLSNGLTLDPNGQPDKSTSPTTLYRNLVGLIGSRGKAAIHDNEVAEAHLQVTLEQRSSKWGVSVDEEIALLTVEQKAFAAVARVLTVMDEMLETLINAVS